MTMPDHIFDMSIQRLQNGERLSAILDSYPEYRTELEPLLQIAQMAQLLPKVTAPAPYKSYKFTNVRTLPYYFTGVLQFVRMAVIPISLVVTLLGGQFVVNAMGNSLPGDTLYSLKRASEEARLNLTSDEEKLATIHVKLTQRRLEEVKKAIDTNNPEVENATLVALQEQTEKTFAAVPHVAAVNAVAKNDSSLLDELVAINKEQKSLYATIENKEDTKEVTKTALNTTKNNEETVAKLIATVNEQTLIDLPNKISVTGTPTVLQENKVVVEKNTFIIDEQTEITNPEGMTVDTLPQNVTKITVIGSRSNQTVIAKQILIISVDPTVPEIGTVKPITTSTKPTTTTTPKTIEPDPTPPTNPEPTPTNEASGTYIVEPIDQQYAP